MVRRLHEAGIEVILDVVYNHTAEGNHLGPTLSFRGIDNASYYMLAADQPLLFRHDRLRQHRQPPASARAADGHGLAPLLGRDLPRRRLPLRPRHLARPRIRPVRPQRCSSSTRSARTRSCQRVKMIAEPWDVGPNGYQLGNFPPGWAEWNGRYRDDMRSLLEGRRGRAPPTSPAACSARPISSTATGGSPGRASISSPPMTASRSSTSGPTTGSTTRRTRKGNRDGHDDNRSWNCGVEGPTDDPAILDLRDRMRRATMATLLLSQGTPMILMGDEVGRTQGGNNNAYCQDNEIAWMKWDGLSERDARLPWNSSAASSRLRKRYPLLRERNFLHGQRDRRQRHPRRGLVPA